MRSDQHVKNKIKGTHILFGISSAIAFAIILSQSSIAIQYMNKGLKLCAETVVPSLFPFMVISEMLVSSGIVQKISAWLAKPSRFLFGVSEGGACAYLLGTVCGFPIGAKSALCLYKKGDISKSEFTRLLTFCNNPSSAFVINAVGSSIFGDSRVGTVLYICVILSSLTVGIAGKILFGNTFMQSEKSKQNEQGFIGVSLFTSSIQNSAISMLTVCAYIAFFSSFIGCVGAITSKLGVLPEIRSALFGFFEISGGVSSASEIIDPKMAILLCSAYLGWSGLSVHFQIMSICSGLGISFAPYFTAKAIQGVLCAVYAGIAFRFVLPIWGKDCLLPSSSLSDKSAGYNATFVCCIFFAAAILPILLELFLRKKRHFESKKVGGKG